ncbi:MAG: hypothetical protein ACI9JL_000455 [Paracoccaceae bacterium]|jgi:hypothetical protein
MVNPRELSIALYGSWRFATLDRAAVQFFDNTPNALWKSFNAAWLALPAYALLVLLSFAQHPVDAGAFRILSVEMISYVIGWVLFPLVMVAFTDTTKSAQNYFRFISAWNWSIVLQAYFFLSISAFSASGTVPESLGGLISLVATLAIFFYQGFIAKTTLDVTVPVAVMIVVIDLTIAIGLSLVSRSLYLAAA